MQKNHKTLFGDHHGLDEKSVDYLTGALEKNNRPGFDYIEFKQSLRALRDMDMEDAVAFKSAFATASTMGLTKDKLLKTAEHYKNVISNEKKQFDEALERQKKQKIDAKQEEVAKLKKQVEEYKAKIAQLQEKIEKAQSTIDHADEHIAQQQEKIEETQSNFEHSMQSILNEIDQDIENINNYL